MPYNFYSYDPRKGHGLPHDPFKSIVGPRPIGWIASQSLEGYLNLAPYSFFNAFHGSPPIIGFASTGYKDSVSNIMNTKEFTWNLASFDLAEKMNITCKEVAPEVNEFELSGLTPQASTLIKPPCVAESKVSFECLQTQTIQLKNAQGEDLESWLTLGEVIYVHIAEDVLENGIYNTGKAGHILRGGGPADYYKIGSEQLFKMYRPK
jgi:flavin reductase (DIM6/NTAB) family NADH-FMN oxidoreductase RutF